LFKSRQRPPRFSFTAGSRCHETRRAGGEESEMTAMAFYVITLLVVALILSIPMCKEKNND